MKLCNRPYIWKERGMIRWPGVLELSWRHYGWVFGFSLIHDWDSEDRWPWMFHVHFAMVQLFLYLPGPRITPKKSEFGTLPYGEWYRWGFSIGFTDPWEGIILNWGLKRKVFEWPWALVFISHDVRRADGSWVPFVGSWEEAQPGKSTDWLGKPAKQPDGREEFVYPYTYILKSGIRQERNATIYVERRQWRPWWTKWTEFGALKKQSIDIRFDDEVGERTGSWKGGCIGCSYDMLPGETPLETLRRMERERKFP